MKMAGLLLLYSSYTDIKNREISGTALILFALAALPLRLLIQGSPITEMLLGAGTGIIMVIISLATQGRLGMGDALLILVTGLYLGFERNLEMLLTALFISAFFSILLFLKEKNLKREYPFVPFLLLAYGLSALFRN